MPGILPSQAHVESEPTPKALAPTVFNVIALSNQPGGVRGRSDGSTWRVHCVAISDDGKSGVNDKGRTVNAIGQGERFLMLFAGNVVRDETFGDYLAALESGNEYIGPCTLFTRAGIGSANRDVIDIVDGTSALAAWEGARKAAKA